eukprot:TRINITY_DN9874_c0_g1_i3.p1 TRINITY_DN9874_c0_g1~~TRINITY_DN9874_c0_g1_i3.p1  ORF type:complete len:219 (-),score=41.31 TRINITY_DN9874_c0_g1_i3:26-592(-)
MEQRQQISMQLRAQTEQRKEVLRRIQDEIVRQRQEEAYQIKLKRQADEEALKRYRNICRAQNIQVKASIQAHHRKAQLRNQRRKKIQEKMVEASRQAQAIAELKKKEEAEAALRKAEMEETYLLERLREAQQVHGIVFQELDESSSPTPVRSMSPAPAPPLRQPTPSQSPPPTDDGFESRFEEDADTI